MGKESIAERMLAQLDDGGWVDLFREFIDYSEAHGRVKVAIERALSAERRATLKALRELHSQPTVPDVKFGLRQAIAAVKRRGQRSSTKGK